MFYTKNTANHERYTFIDTEMHGQILLMCHPKNDSINDYIHYNYEQVLLFTHINNVQRNGYIFWLTAMINNKSNYSNM